MKILAFDTSSNYLTVSLSKDNKILSSFHEDVGLKHNEILMSTINTVLVEAGLTIKDIDLIAVGIGPGSFTGLRIAAATAKGISAVLGTKIAAVPTFDIIAMNYIGKKIKKLTVVMDARKNKVYTASYDISGEFPLKLTDCILVEKEKIYFNENGVTFVGDILDALDNDFCPKAINIARLGENLFHNKRLIDPSELDPLYIYSKECSMTGK
ncbi:MAG: tRNA (adenosine(37)-N6)-threonylcarbamoyltransferase complex dimerization subunit type 1 TsaB [Candidatus Omnitrophica bacterium]|nr:tRNA (adenosine(37)-N6)-threonylcarbamoyltransferase complex dimerization subunit type 1 TsaB [Candidatus Omnitrophota bacterium]